MYTEQASKKTHKGITDEYYDHHSPVSTCFVFVCSSFDEMFCILCKTSRSG